MNPNNPPPAWPEALREAEALHCRLARSAWALLATSALLLAAGDGARERRKAVKQPRADNQPRRTRPWTDVTR